MSLSTKTEIDMNFFNVLKFKFGRQYSNYEITLKNLAEKGIELEVTENIIIKEATRDLKDQLFNETIGEHLA